MQPDLDVASLLAADAITAFGVALPLLFLAALMGLLGVGSLRHAAGRPRTIAAGFVAIGLVWMVAGAMFAALPTLTYGATGLAATLTAAWALALISRPRH